MSKVLVGIVNWINQPGHEREIVWLDLEVYREDQDPSAEQGHLRRHPRLATRSGQSAPVEHTAAQHGADRHVDERDLGAARSPADHRHRLVELHGDDPMTTGRLRRRVLGPNIWDTISPELDARKYWMTGKLVTGAYYLAIQGTPSGVTGQPV